MERKEVTIYGMTDGDSKSVPLNAIRNNDGTYALQLAIGSQPSSSNFVHEPAANTAAVITLGAPGAGVANVIGGLYWSYDAAPTAGSLTVVEIGSDLFKVDITAAGPGFFPFDPPLRGSANAAVSVTLAAGGADVDGIINVHAWTE